MPTQRRATYQVIDYMIQEVITEFKINKDRLLELLNRKHVIDGETYDGLMCQNSIFNYNNKKSTYYIGNKKCSYVLNEKKCTNYVSKTGNIMYCSNHQPEEVEEIKKTENIISSDTISYEIESDEE